MATFTYSGTPVSGCHLDATLYITAYRISQNYVRVELSSSSKYSTGITRTGINPTDIYIGVYAYIGGNHGRLNYASGSVVGNFPYGYNDFYVGTGTSFTFTIQINFSVGNAGGNNVFPTPQSYTFYVDSGAYTVSYNGNLSGATNVPSAQTKYYDTSLTLSSKKPTKSDVTSSGAVVTLDGNGGTSPSSLTATNKNSYSFSKWNTSSNGSGTNYSPGGKYTSNSSVTLYGQWSSSSSKGSVTLPSTTRSKETSTGATVKFLDNNGSSLGISNRTSTKTTKFTFNGWNTKINGNGTSYSSGDAISPSGDLTLYAQWTSKVTYGSVTLPSATKTNYYFQGWTKTKGSSSVSYIEGATISPTEDMTLYAVWATAVSGNHVLCCDIGNSKKTNNWKCAIDNQKTSGSTLYEVGGREGYWGYDSSGYVTYHGTRITGLDKTTRTYKNVKYASDSYISTGQTYKYTQ